MIISIIGLTPNLATSRLTNISIKIKVLYDTGSICEILFVSSCMWCKHKGCHTRQTYIFKISANVKSYIN